MPVFFRLICVFLICLFLNRCASVPARHNSVSPLPRPDYLVREYTPTEEWIEKSRVQNPDGSWHIELIPQDNPDFPAPLALDLFPTPTTGPQPALLVSPILGGKNTVANHFARYFAAYGYHSLVVHRPKDLTRESNSPEKMDRQLRNAILRDRVALNWLEKQPGVNPQALGSFGISYGGIKNVVLAGVDERLKVNIFALAGADLSTIISRSNLKNLRKTREEILKQNQWDQNRLETALRDTLRTEPLRFTPYINRNTTLLILARMDNTVPRRNGEILRDALDNPQTLYLPVGHYSGLLLTGLFLYPYIENQALDFLDEHLKPLSSD